MGKLSIHNETDLSRRFSSGKVPVSEGFLGTAILIDNRENTKVIVMDRGESGLRSSQSVLPI